MIMHMSLASVNAVVENSPDDLVICSGACTVMVAHDIGFGIDIEHASRLARAPGQRLKLRHSQRVSHHVQFDPPPLVLTYEVASVQVGSVRTIATVEAVVYDFGAVSLSYRIPYSGPLSGLLRIAGDLWEPNALLKAAREEVSALLRVIEPAVTRADLGDHVEDYVVYQIPAQRTANGVLVDLERLGPELAKLLRAESGSLSPTEIQEALSGKISYSPDDLALIDWNAAVLFGAQTDDLLPILEFANVELLQLRRLDDQLDSALDSSYRALHPRPRSGLLFGAGRADRHRIAEMQLDAAMLFEGVNNALKLVGDPYLARVYRLAGARLHHADWDASILRKLRTLESIYDKISGHFANRRIEFLEIVIIVLIAIEVVMSLTGFH